MTCYGGTHLVTAIKPYKCDQCKSPIEIGATYELTTGVEALGVWYCERTCLDCLKSPAEDDIEQARRQR